MAVALKGIKVLDLSRILAGPWASQMLADLGADVIKVERPEKGDDTRHWGPPFIEPAENNGTADAAYFHCANRNKQSIAVDISCAEGQKIIRALAQGSDVFIENYKVGGLAKYGLDYSSLRKYNPRLVYCSITGFGQSGPAADKAGYDAMIQAEGGLMSITGEPDGSPMKVGVALVDVMTGLYSCNAILAALMARQHTQQGQYIDMALLDVQVAALANQGMNYLTTGEDPQRLGNGHPNIVPYQVFATQNGNMILAVGNDNQFRRFCQVADCLELAEKFLTNEQRVDNREHLLPQLAAILASKTTEQWIETLSEKGVPCGPVNALQQVFTHPQVHHRQLHRQVPNSHGNMVNTIASPINLSDTPVQYNNASPELGQHTRLVLANRLGYGEEEIEALLKRKAIG